jgi:hypothetical protein
MLRFTVVFAIGVCLAAVSPSAFSHHSQPMYTDASGAISITGVVKKFEFTNPPPSFTWK